MNTMNEILRKRIEKAAAESRRASAETLTTFGLQSSIDDVVELTGMELSYDEVSESAFEKGAEYALSHQWIIVDEALPKEDSSVFMNVYVEIDTGHGIEHCTIIAAYAFGKFSCETKHVKVIAWMPIPKFDDKNNK